jgi:hypothetical protein
MEDATARVSMERLAPRGHTCHGDQDGQDQTAGGNESAPIAHPRSGMGTSSSHDCRSSAGRVRLRTASPHSDGSITSYEAMERRDFPSSPKMRN